MYTDASKTESEEETPPKQKEKNSGELKTELQLQDLGQTITRKTCQMKTLTKKQKGQGR